MWDIPKAWSLRDAATVPVAYLTAYYALVMRGGLEKGHKVLVHSGTGAVGLAAIRICLHRGCEVRLCRTRLFGNLFTLSHLRAAGSCQLDLLGMKAEKEGTWLA